MKIQLFDEESMIIDYKIICQNLWKIFYDSISDNKDQRQHDTEAMSRDDRTD